MAVGSCSAGVIWHCRTAISKTCSFVPAEILKPVNIEISRHITLNGHLSCRSCRQYIKPTLTGHFICRSCKPTSAPPVDSFFSRHSLQSQIPLLKVTALIFILLFLISETNKEDNFFQNKDDSHICANRNKPTLGCITLTHSVRFWTTFEFNKAIYSCSYQRCTCSLNVCNGFTSIIIKLPRSRYFSHFQRLPRSLWRRCGLSGRLQMHFVITNIHCPVFPSCYMCHLSSHIITPVHNGSLSTLPL